MQSVRPKRLELDLQPGDHLCCIYETEEEHRQVVTSFLRQGLEQGEKVIYIAEERTAETILEYLREEGLAVAPYLETGQLGILTADQAYVREEAFDPEKMIALLREETERALEEGYPALRVTGEMTWVLRGLSGSERLIEYEAKLNEFLPGSRCLAICQYDRRRFEPGLLLDVLTAHPTVVIGTEVYDNFYCLRAEDFLGPEPEKVKLESWIHNLAERRQAEEERQKSQARLQNIIERNADGIIIVDHEGIVRFVNPSTELLFAKEAREFVGQMFGLPVVAGEATEIEVISAGGDKLTAEMRVVEMEWEGNPASLAALRDITSRKRIENELRASEEKHRMLVDNLPGIVFWGHKDWSVEFMDRKVEELTGYRVEDFHSGKMKWSDLILEEDFDSAQEAFVEALKTDRSYVREYRLKTRVGTAPWIQERSQIVCDDRGEVRYVSGVLFDVTERKDLEEQLFLAQKMEAVGRLAGGIAHDFNNLLTSVIGNADLILMGLGEDDPRRRDVEEIKKAGERGASLTRQLLAFGRRQVLEPVVLDLKTVVADMEKMLLRLIGEDIALNVVPAPQLGRVKADPGQIEQVILNLAVNARDAMPRGGTLTIETADIYLDEGYAHKRPVTRPGPYVMLAVSDTGVGMDKETLSRLFEPFFTTKELGKGTGLGLATVYGIVKQSGGYIWVYSEPGEGTTFKIYLPRVEGEVELRKAEDMPTERLFGSETVLLVEDDEMVLNLARAVLRRYGYRVLEATDSQEASRASKTHAGPIHLLLTDVVMPGMSGRELAESLQGQRPEMKVLFMSGYTDNGIINQVGLPPASPFLQKPFAPEALVRKIREVLDAPAAETK